MNVATGNVLASGDTVPAGTQVAFEFVPHDYTDISWFGAGSWNGSPYGDWLTGAAAPEFSVTRSCLDKDLYYSDYDNYGQRKFFAALSVDPPNEAVTTPASLSCAQTSSGKNCTFSQPGQYTATFNFDPTTGKFYARDVEAGGCYGNQKPMYGNGNQEEGGENSYTLNVASQSIPFVLNVGPAVGTAPITPTVAAVTGSTSCTTGVPYTITMSATDPDGDQLRYGIDWNADGSVDEWVPPSGYVPSGTAETASRTYSLAGSKTVKVLAQDANGLSSGWATLSFTCADAQNTNTNQTVGSFNRNANSNVNQNESGGSLIPDLELRALPSIVAKGRTTKLNWSATNVASCTVTAPNGDLWNTINSIVGGNTSKPITAATTYTLKCLDLQGITQTKTATINILPNFQEL